MSLTTCKCCHNPVSQDAKTCPHCGHNLKKDNPNKGKFLFWIIAIIGIFAFLGLFINKVDHNDGKCDICNKKATYSANNEEYCDEHLEKALKWYFKQNSGK